MRDQFSVSADYVGEQHSFGQQPIYTAATGYGDQTRALYRPRGDKMVFPLSVLLIFGVVFVGVFVLGNYIDITSWLPF